MLKNRLMGRILAMFLCILLFQGCAMFLGSTVLYSRAIDEQVYASKVDILAQMEKNVTILTGHIVSLLQMYESSLPLEDALRYPAVQNYEALKLALELQRRAYEYPLTAVRDSFDIVIYGINGTLIRNDRVSFHMQTDLFTRQPWYGRLLEDPDGLLWMPGSGGAGVFEEKPGEDHFLVAHLLRNPYDGTIYGIVLLRFSESSLYSIYQNQSGPHHQVAIVNQYGEVISSSDRDAVGKQFPPGYGEVLQEGQLVQRDVGDNSYRVGSAAIPSTPLRLYTLTPEAELTRYSRRVLGMAGAVALASFLIGLFLAVAFSRQLTKPLVGILQRLRLRQDRLSGKAAAVPHDLALLASEYDVLLENLEGTIDQLDQAQEKKRLAELQMLQYQINPHFLYNTLSCIKCLVWTGRTHLIEPVTDALTSLLENTLSRRQEMISVGEDLERIRDYLTIQRIRLCREIALEIRCLDSRLMELPLPKLLLQPIVENCVFHGIEPTGRDGTIVITVSEAQGRVRILIEDDGAGISSRRADEIFTLPEQDSSHIGVRNVSERIALYYGGQGSLELFPRTQGGTCVRITIPFDGTD